MTEQLEGNKYENLQHLISESTWDAKGLMVHLSKNVKEDLKDKGLIGYTVDKKSFLKKGTESAGVARQHTGTIGKIDNCQVAVLYSLEKMNPLLGSSKFICNFEFKEFK